MKTRRTLGTIACCLLALPVWSDVSIDPWSSRGRAPDSTQKSVAEIRESERRRIPLDVALQVSNRYRLHDPIEVTVMVTNLFDPPLLLNSRMLINHPRLQGEMNFTILGPDGKSCEIQRLVTPMAVHDNDFVVLNRGQSIQRTIDLSDFYSITRRGPYKVRVTYRNDVDHPVGRLRAWKGVVSSDVSDFQIL